MKKNRIRMWQIVMAAASVTVAAGLVGGCSSSPAESICDLAYECRADAKDRLECVANVLEARELADEKGCRSQLDEYLACIESEGECVEGAFNIDACEAVGAKVVECETKAAD